MVEKLIKGGADKLGISLDEFCGRLFPPGQIGNERKEIIRQHMERFEVSRGFGCECVQHGMYHASLCVSN